MQIGQQKSRGPEVKGGESPTNAIDPNTDGTDSRAKQDVKLGKVIETLVNEGQNEEKMMFCVACALQFLVLVNIINMSISSKQLSE